MTYKLFGPKSFLEAYQVWGSQNFLGPNVVLGKEIFLYWIFLDSKFVCSCTLFCIRNFCKTRKSFQNSNYFLPIIFTRNLFCNTNYFWTLSFLLDQTFLMIFFFKTNILLVIIFTPEMLSQRCFEPLILLFKFQASFTFG